MRASVTERAALAAASSRAAGEGGGGGSPPESEGGGGTSSRRDEEVDWGGNPASTPPSTRIPPDATSPSPAPVPPRSMIRPRGMTRAPPFPAAAFPDVAPAEEGAGADEEGAAVPPALSFSLAPRPAPQPGEAARASSEVGAAAPEPGAGPSPPQLAEEGRERGRDRLRPIDEVMLERLTPQLARYTKEGGDVQRKWESGEPESRADLPATGVSAHVSLLEAPPPRY